MKKLYIFILFCIFKVASYAATPVIVQHSPSTCRNTANATTQNCAFASPVTAGHMILVCVGAGNSVTINTPTMTGETFTKITGMSSTIAAHGQNQCYSRNSAAGGQTTVTVTVAPTDTYHIHMLEISGQAASPIDATGNATSAATYTVSTSGSTTSGSDLVFAFVFDFDANNATIVAGAGYTEVVNTQDAPSGDYAESESQTASATPGTQTATWNQTTTGDTVNMSVVAIAASTGGGGGSPTGVPVIY